jgi:ribonuclease Y
MPPILWAVIGLIAGAAATYGLLIFTGKNIVEQAKSQAAQSAETSRLAAEAKAREIQLAAQDELRKRKEEFSKESQATRQEIKDMEARLAKREDTLDRKLDTLAVKEKNLEDLETRLTLKDRQAAAKEIELNDILKQQRDKLLQISGVSADQAKEMLLRRVEDECKRDVGEIIQRMTEQAQEEAREKSRNIILAAIQRYAADQTSDHTVSTVTIPSDDMKGRVIGREGRNIRSFEKATGVDVIIDDTPGVVVVSCFDPVRREIARMSLERLVQDGRIHPARIEEVVVQTTKEMDEELMKIGKEAIQEANLPTIPKPVIPMLGRLAYRTSYGQNVLRHSMEVAYLAQTIADELGLDGNVARRCGLLHDIGKAMDHETEGGHPQIGMDFLRKFSESEAVLNATAGHHGDVPASTPYTPIIMAADAISASRPGARRESLERYVKRLQELEELAKGFEGVRQAYAIQAGREIRVIVDARSVDDKVTAKIARDISKKIESDLTYPGEIKITVIREVRTVEYAR